MLTDGTGCGHMCADGISGGSLPGRRQDTSLSWDDRAGLSQTSAGVGKVGLALPQLCGVTSSLQGHAREAWSGEGPAVPRSC